MFGSDPAVAVSPGDGVAPPAATRLQVLVVAGDPSTQPVQGGARQGGALRPALRAAAGTATAGMVDVRVTSSVL